MFYDGKSALDMWIEADPYANEQEGDEEMPIYEFLCPKCQENGTEPSEFDILAPMNDRYSMVCPNCGGGLKLIPSVPGKAVWNCDCPTASGGK